MNAFLEAKKKYKDGELERIMAFCAEHGVVICDSEVFICAYTTKSTSIINCKRKYNLSIDKADTWYVFIASGNLNKAFDLIRPMEFVAFRRMDKRFRIYDFDRFRRVLEWVIQHQ